MNKDNSNPAPANFAQLHVVWRPEDAKKISHYVKFALEDGTVNLSGNGAIDFKHITEELIITIYETLINEDQEFDAWRKTAAEELPLPALKEYFTPPRPKSSRERIYSHALRLASPQTQLLYQYIKYYQKKNSPPTEILSEEYKLGALIVQNLVMTYINTDTDFAGWWHRNPEKLKAITIKDCFTVLD